ncbi:MAG: class I SAM-dependent methyltransferase [Anaeromyxobacter sp.]
MRRQRCCRWTGRARRGTGFWERAALRARRWPGFCNVCSQATVFELESDNLRETLACRRCGSFNRQRQLAAVLLEVAGLGAGAGVARLPRRWRVWNLEARRALHQALAARLGQNHVASEFLDAALPSGAVRDGVLHVDAQRTHFPDGAFEAVLSSDVLEHVPRPAAALAELYRVLAPGGHAIFTVPFHGHRFCAEVRAEPGPDGTVRHLAPPVYHEDPVRPEGALVYTIFGIESLCELERVGFEPRLVRVRSPLLGILGSNGLVVHARRPA